ncbi:MAG: transglycosylase domain-containing protein [Actinomycetota bacterium]|nr:transglycosylase domain-containing protein [Actinomycetota bacterium]
MLPPLRWVVVVVVCVICAPILVAGSALATLVYRPVPADLPQPAQTNFGARASVVYDATGQVIGEFRAAAGSNLAVKDAQIPALVKDAVVASEDRNFFHEGPVSVTGILRAAWADVSSGRTARGGSTITEQYVKNVYTNGSRTIDRKLQETVVARTLAQKLTKEDILHRYLSIVYFGQGAYGVGAAAQAYFRTSVSNLDASQAATLAGVLPAPSRYNPLFDLQAGEQRREVVLGLMHQQGYLTAPQYQAAMAERLVQATPASRLGPAATLVYPPQQAPTRYRYFLDYVRQYLEQRIGYDELYNGGLRVQTTLDPRDQAAAEKAVADQLAGTKPPLQMALASVQPATGYVAALVGGRSYDLSQVDIALGGCPRAAPPPVKVVVPSTCQADPNSVVQGGGSGRLAGSSFKPFVLAAALAQGISPQAAYSGPASSSVPGCGGVCVIHNDRGEAGNFTLTTATWQSIDTVYAQVIQQVGIPAVAQMAKNLGVSSAYDESDFGVSYALGANPVSPLEMASAYATFANQGVRVEPSPVVSAVDGQGRAVFDDVHPRGTRVLSPAVADTVTEILAGVIQHGTGNPTAMIGRPAAGKTGTANGPTDAWFVGYTPQLSAATWMGYGNNDSTPMLDVKGVQVYGATYPAHAWHDFMVASLAGAPPAAFAVPPPLDSVAQVAGLQAGPLMAPTSVTGSGPVVPPDPPPPTAVAPSTLPSTTTTTTTAPTPSFLPPSPTSAPSTTIPTLGPIGP